MDAFAEFHEIVRELQAADVDYALVGGVAMAFYATPRFTRDVDILIEACSLDRVSACLRRCGYRTYAEPWTFRDIPLTLHRFVKVADEEEMVIDLLVSGDDRCTDVIENARDAESSVAGTVRVASREDLIWLKRQRNSAQDQADIERLRDEER